MRRVLQENSALGLLLVVFILLHLYGLRSPYHQDEYKWPIIVNPALTEPGGIPHPPLGEFIYRELSKIVGYDNFRVIPFIFGILNFFLLFYLAKILFDTKTALWSVTLFTISFYSLLASLMVDTDGAIMPFFFLILVISFMKLRQSNFSNIKWLCILIISAIGGFFIKASFVLAIGAILLEFLIIKGIFRDRKKILKYFIYILCGATALAALLYLSKILFPYFKFDSSVKYWEHFMKFGGRGWFQTLIQFSKSILYASPLLILPVFFQDREVFYKTRLFNLFIFLGLIFYLVLFDFSTGALDRYFQFLVLPLCLISGAVFSKYLKKSDIFDLLIIFVIAISIFILQFFNQFVPSLYPKTEWIHRILSFRWNFLYPFSGGSGPIPFYVSFLLIAAIWICGIIFVLSGYRKNISRALVGILILGTLYNVVFIEEYLFGKINGSSSKLVHQSVKFIEENPEIKKVIVYNDNGGWEVQKTQKYERRLYASPDFEETYKSILAGYEGDIMLVEIPKIDPNSFYALYLSSCKPIYSRTDKYIEAQILSCRK